MAQQRYSAITEHGSTQDKLNKMFAAEIRRLDEQALRSVLKSKEGRWFLMRLLDATRLNSSSFTGNSTTFFNEGRRAIGIELLDRVKELGIEAVKLKQKGEMEYIEHQLKAREIVTEYLEHEQEGE